VIAKICVCANMCGMFLKVIGAPLKLLLDLWECVVTKKKYKSSCVPRDLRW